ncbi:unnamed protein product [Rotaria sordida]|uniref:Uncharacterized protein n=1 Tax=Rotaria sordida TaxID=392033 RepID=A0A819P050_9BILA|nr:unnamed protein product [Rotaria sordida]
MSSINYNNNNTNNQIPLRDPNAPPRLVRNISRRGGVLGRNNNYLGRNNNYLGRNNYYIDGNQFYRRNRGNIFNYRRYPPNYYRRNFFYNRNYRIPRQYFIPNDIGGYGFVGQRQQQQLRPIQPVRSPSRCRLKPNRILKWLEEHSRSSKNAISGRVDRARQTTAAGTVETDTDDELGTGTTGTAPTTTVKNYVREPAERIEKYILEYIHFCTQHVKKMAQTRIQLAKAQMEEYKALEDFEQIATPT